MSEEKWINKQQALEPYQFAYRVLEQLERENEEKIKFHQQLHDQIQKTKEITHAFILDTQSIPEDKVPSASSYFLNVQKTGNYLYHNFLNSPTPLGASITAGSASINIAALTGEAIDLRLADFKNTETVLHRLNIPLRSNLETMRERVLLDAPCLAELADSIIEALEQTTCKRRYESAANKLRDLLSELSKHLSPESDAEGADFDRHEGRLTQASRWRFAIYRFLPKHVYQKEIQEKCDPLVTALRKNYEALSGLSHNRSEAYSGDACEPLINQTALNVIEFQALRHYAFSERCRMVEMEIRKSISLVLPSDLVHRSILAVGFNIPLTAGRTLDLEYDVKLSAIETVFKGHATIILDGKVQVQLLENPFGNLETPPLLGS